VSDQAVRFLSRNVVWKTVDVFEVIVFTEKAFINSVGLRSAIEITASNICTIAIIRISSVVVKDWLLEDKDNDLGSEEEDEDKDLRSEDEDKDSNFKCWSTLNNDINFLE